MQVLGQPLDDVARLVDLAALNRRMAGRHRRVEDIDKQANQFAMAKAIASGDSLLMQKAGLENEIARLERQCAAHFDDQLDIRWRIHAARHDQQSAEARIAAIREDLGRRIATRGDAFTMEVAGRTCTERKLAGSALLSKIRMAVLERAPRAWSAVDLGDKPARLASAAPSRPTRSPIKTSSCGVWREWLPRPPQTWMPSFPAKGVKPRFSAPMTLVVIPEECQSIP